MRIKGYISAAMLAICLPATAGASTPAEAGRQQADASIGDNLPADCDTIVERAGYNVRVVKAGGEVRTQGLALFSEDMKKCADADLLDYIETALLALTTGNDKERYADVKLEKGKYSDFKGITPTTSCGVTKSDSKKLTASWKIAEGREVKVSVPVGYDTGKAGTRSDIENGFISAVKVGKEPRAPFGKFSPDDLQPYGEDMYLLPGGSYQSKDVTRNAYFDMAETPSPVWDASHPAESIANLVVYPSDNYGSPRMEVTVLKHEYGKKETFEVPLDRFIAEAEKSGCLAFWGVEKLEGGVLEGAIFLYNSAKGYDHVLKIECNPSDVITGNGVVKARASLFIPTNNVRNLYAPYVKKMENEKIKYGEK